MPGGAVAEDLLPLLRAIFAEVRAFLLGEGRGHLETGRMNPRGDVSKAFDLEAGEGGTPTPGRSSRRAGAGGPGAMAGPSRPPPSRGSRKPSSPWTSTLGT